MLGLSDIVRTTQIYFFFSSSLSGLLYKLLPLLYEKKDYLPAMEKTHVQSLDQEDLLRREWLTTPVFLPGESHGQRSLVGYCLCGHKELDTTEAN